MNTLEVFVQKGEQIGLERGLERGLKKGEQRKAEKTCRNMIAQGFDYSIIAKLLEVDMAFVEKIAADMEQ